MPIDFLSKPYYDDYDESREYARILFRPNKAVQARELTQLQTMIQKQMERLGKFVIEDGSVVTGGQTTLDTVSTSIEIEEYTGTNISELNGQTISGGQSKARVITTVDTVNEWGLDVTNPTIVLKNLTGIPVDHDFTPKMEIIVSNIEYAPEADNPKRLSQSGAINGTVVRITELNGGNYSVILDESSYDILFWNSDSDLIDEFDQVYVKKENILKVSRIFDCSNGETVILKNVAPKPSVSVSVDDGVYFTRGIFNKVNKQTIPVSLTSNSVSARIGLLIEESIVDDGTDPELNDPAQGYPNYAAPGATRYKIHLKLVTREYTSDINSNTDNSNITVVSNTADSDFIELIRLDNGIIKKKNDYPVLAEIEKIIARRTFEESGNYTIRHFPIRFDAYQATNSKFKVSIEPGKAYVFGREFETISMEEILIDKARSVDSVNENNISTYYGGYFETKEVYFHNGNGASSIDYSSLPEVILKNSATVIGKANVRLISRNQSNYRIYLFNIHLEPGQKLTDTNGLYYNSYSIASVDGKFRDGSNQSLIFKLPEEAISTLRPRGIGAGYEIIKKNIITGTLTFSDSGGANSSYTSMDVSDYLVFDGDGDIIPNDKYTISRNGSFGIILIIDSSYNTNQGPFTIYSPQTISNISERRKTLTTFDIVNENLASSGPGTPDLQLQDFAVGKWYGLGVSDVNKIRVTYVDTDSSVIDITSYFELDSGQTDGHYDWGRVRRTSAIAGLADMTLLKLSVSYFKHVGDGYLSVDSYSSTYQDIPTYQSPSGKYDLRDCIDFRPYRMARATDPVLMSLDISSQDFEDTRNYTTYGFLPSLNTIPSYRGIANFDFSYYLPRIDYISLTGDLKFKHVTGIPSKNPKAPTQKENEMPLYVLTIPAYTFNLDDILVQYIDNKRYTMRDIGELEKRVDKIEYYTTLSLLEKDAENVTILNDAQDSERYKTGILVDSFVGHNIGDVTNNDYNCSVDILNQQLHPPFNSDIVKMNFYNSDDDNINESSSNVQKTGNLVTLKYTAATLIDQPLATTSTSVNPFDYSSYIGRAVLSPPCDPWYDQSTRPEVIINKHGENDAVEFGKNFINTIWEDWSLRGLGVTSQNSINRSQLSLTNKTNILTDSKQSLSTNSQNLSDSGFNLAYRENFQLLGNDIVPIDIRPYIRSQIVAFSVFGLTPNTAVYLYFDGQKINPLSNSLTDSSGALSGSFSIPEKTFRVGIKQLKIADVSSWKNVSQATCMADVYFMAQGLAVQLQGNVTSTEVPQYARKTITDSTVNFDITEKVYNNYTNPLAQTFSISSTDHPEGVFLDSVDLYFETKPNVGNLPIYLEIRPTVSGYPHSTMYMPFSQVVKTKDDILTGLNNKTNFKFDSPVYLDGGEEYAIVIHSNDREYSVYTAKLGENQLDSQILVSKQPYSGNLFKPQNSSSWKPDINEDLKFSLNRCKFSLNSGYALFRNTTPNKYMYGNILHVGSSNLTLNSSTLSFSVKKKNAATMLETPNTLDANYKIIPAREDISFVQKIQIETTSSPSIMIRGDMITSRDDISPVIDVAFLNSVLVDVQINKLDANDTSELLPENGNGIAKYITRSITLNDSSRDVLVYFDAYKPVGSNIRIFYKTSSVANEGLNEKPYEEMTLTGNAGVFSTKTADYKSYKYETGRTNANDNFITFSVKILLESSDSITTPVVKNLKIISVDATSDE